MMDEDSDYKARYGPWAMVIGGSVGLGEALARELARRGMNVAITARGQDKLDLAAARIRADFAVETKSIAADLADPDILDKLLAGMGGIPVDFLIYNAASEHIGEFLAQDLERHLENIAINCTVPTRLVHRFAGEMAARGRGGIVLCSSLGAAQGMYSLSTYGASKSFENLLAQTLWFELQPHGVDVTSFMIGSTSMGFERCASMPLASDFFTSSSKAFADIATMGMPAASARLIARMARVASRPSMTGMRISMRIAA